ncbi:von Willebrand factor type A domain-containing protein [Mycena amicta]|nr:von Willebrand factor type A domain-containing protein [Mycena amicta]
MPPRQGIVHTNGVDGMREYLSLHEMRAKVIIVDLAARITLTQIFRNTLQTATSRASFYFPVPARGAVCGFQLKTSDDRTVVAVCKEKAKAREEYEQALAQGQESSLLEWVEDDVFTISVGSIPGKATVCTTLVYTMVLPNENTDEIRFQLPSCVGERYGPPLTALVGASAPSSSTRIRIAFEIQTSGRIQSITSPSHQITESAYKTHLNRPSRRRTMVRYRSATFLEKDFVLVIQAEGLDEPRCFAELQSDKSGRHSDTVAMQLSLVPRFKLPPVVGQEYIFLVDRSGSMAGARIETAKRTLNLILRMLPTKGSHLNIFSFGTRCSPLWNQSKPYNQATLAEASTHVSIMDANYGGTEIKKALEAVFASRNTSSSTAVFVLTDGDVTEQDSVIASIQHAVQQSRVAGPRCRLRVFCLGIGDGVSTAMCEGIARAGDGVCLFAVHTESIVGKCAALFHAGRKNFVHNVRVDWGVPDENLSLRSSVNFSTPRSSPSKVRLRPAPSVQQTPARIADLHAGTRINIYAILTLRKTVVPKEVIITGDLDGGGEFKLVVPVRGIQLDSRLPLVHTLAAWRLIQDHQERTQPLAAVLVPPDASEDEIRKASIVRLGERYQVASRHTSFLAVADTPTEPTPRPAVPSTTAAPYRDPPATGLLAMFHRLFNPPSDDGNDSQFDMDIPGGWRDSVVDENDGRTGNGNDDDGYESARTLSTLSSFEEDSSWSDWTDERLQPRISEEDARRMQCPSPKLEPLRLAPAARRHHSRSLPVVRQPPPPPIDPKVVQLVELQLFDGSFDDAIRGVVGEDVLKLADHLDRKLWMTGVSIAFISKNLADPGQKELLEDLVEKAYAFLYSNGWDEPTVKRVVQAARDVL